MKQLASFIDATEKSGYIADVNLNGGGEPLLWKNLKDGLELLKKSNSIERIEITTNGILKDKILMALKYADKIIVSDYDDVNIEKIENEKILYEKHETFFEKLFPAKTPCYCRCSGPMLYGNYIFPSCGPPVFDAIDKMGLDIEKYRIPIQPFYASEALKEKKDLEACKYCWANMNCEEIKHIHKQKKDKI